MSIMHVFRDAAEAKDSRDPGRHYHDGERDVTVRSQKRREGASDASLRRDLARDVASLMNTIRLDTVSDLTDAPYVQESIVNFGFQDLEGIWKSNSTMRDIASAIRTALIRNEPRLRSETLDVRVREEDPSPDQRVTFEISGEMISSPSDIAMEFLAEVDPSLGKIQMKRMQGES
ncbi:type VI secretion system protein ImpF (plasmid) [Paracoccus aminophilus JCM 7686]|uniref:Type VI secretion system protein ImpF n=2 Tax=Paracoccus aminophilus TaxID=34003 RepID=S5Y204_PARAH|nr:type VI secretion system protein ImpF [Paracoccus aminophilus JCM 7686]